MTLGELLNGVIGEQLSEETALIAVTAITSDSRKVPSGAVFFAYKGVKYDSHADAERFLKSGAVSCVVSERPVEGGANIIVPDGRRAFALASRTFFGKPDEGMDLVGVTGTNGKTTTTYLLESIFAAAGAKVVRIGTTGASVAGEEVEIDNTTPGAYEFNEFLAKGRDKGCTVSVSEVSSHALEQGRLEGIHYDAAIFTNLTGDHLDYHGDMESYYQAKALLFTDRFSTHKIINRSNEYGKRLAAEAGSNVVTFSVNCDADIRCISHSIDLGGTTAEVDVFGKRFTVRSPLVGAYNLENILGALAAAYSLGIEMDVILKGIENLANVPGRLERYVGGGVSAFVDYAHTDDAMDNVLSALKKLATGRIISVFGCGGDRDKTKRPRMGRVSQKYADISVVTSDNPRTEVPEMIIDDILAGMTQGEDVVVKVNREEAIAYAVEIARPGDIVFIGGKGHEDYQIVGTTKYPFDDRLIAQKYLQAKA